MATSSSGEEKALSTQEHIETKARDGWHDPATGRPARTDSNGTGSSARSAGDRLPRPPGRRRPGLAVIAVLLIVLGAAVAGLLALRIDERVPVLVARHQISVGQRIDAGDLSVARMASEGVNVIPADRAADVIGRYASQQIASGRLLDAGMLNTSGLLTPGQAAVGVALQPGRFPAGGLETGDIVQVVRSVDGAGRVLAGRAVIGSVNDPSEGTFGSGGSNTTVVTVVVSDRLSPDVAAAAMADELSLVLLGRGDPAGGG
jgi:hypothetical protein